MKQSIRLRHWGWEKVFSALQRRLVFGDCRRHDRSHAYCPRVSSSGTAHRQEKSAFPSAVAGLRTSFDASVKCRRSGVAPNERRSREDGQAWTPCCTRSYIISSSILPLKDFEVVTANVMSSSWGGRAESSLTSATAGEKEESFRKARSEVTTEYGAELRFAEE